MTHIRKLLSAVCMVFTCLTLKQVSSDIIQCPNSDFPVNLTYGKIEECQKSPCPIQVGSQKINARFLLDTPEDESIHTIYFTTRAYGAELNDEDFEEGEVTETYVFNPYRPVANKDLPTGQTVQVVTESTVYLDEDTPPGKKFTLELNYWIVQPTFGPKYCVQVDCITK